MNTDFMKGWNAARSVWQSRGSVPAYPPQEEYIRTKMAGGAKREDAEKMLAEETARREKAQGSPPKKTAVKPSIGGK